MSEATVRPVEDFDPVSDAEALKEACRGIGSDKEKIIEILANRSNQQRLEIAAKYKTAYGKDLLKKLKDNSKGDLQMLFEALVLPLNEYYATELHDAIKGFGTDEKVLIEILCTLPNGQIKEIREEYEKKYDRDLEDDIKGDTSGVFKRLLVSLCNASRNANPEIDPEKAKLDAEDLYKAGEGRWGTDESVFNKILCERSEPQLKLIFQEYERISGNDIEKAIKSEFSGDAKKGFLAVVRSIKNPERFYAKLLNKCVKGLGTKDRSLIRLIVTRCEIDMKTIKDFYGADYNESLENAIKGDTSGSYQKCLLALIEE